MKKTLFALLFLQYICFCHAQSIEFKEASINIEKWNETQLIIPVEVEIINESVYDQSGTLSLSLDNVTATRDLQLSSEDFGKIEIRKNHQVFSLKRKKKFAQKKTTKTFYVVLDENIKITSNKTFYVNAIIGPIIKSLEINLEREDDLQYTLSDYLQNNKLNKVNEVKSANNVLTIYGEKDNKFQKKTVALKPGEAYSILSKNYLFKTGHWKSLDAFSIFSIPYKVRPEISAKINDKDTTLPKNAVSGLSNIGLNLEIGRIQFDTYLSNGKKSAHKLNAGIFIAPTVEELDSIYTGGYLNKDITSKQLFVSTGLTIAYSFNNVSFVFVPLGWDFGNSGIGKKWVYSGKRWWGFGIGVNPQIFSAIVNK